MSCCDGAVVTINNQTSKQTVDIVSVETFDHGSTLRGITVGQTVGALSQVQGQAYSDGNSKGAAAGQIGIKIDGVPFTLDYTFNASDAFGHCPCYASGSSSPDNGGFSVTIQAHNGDNNASSVNFYVQGETTTT